MQAGSVTSENGRPSQDILGSAIAMHRAGHLGEAAVLYASVLAQDETNVSALHLFGTLHHQRGDDVRAVELIRQALALRPNMPVVHANLAEAYRGLGQLDRAVGCCRLSLKLFPECPEAMCNLGLALHVLGRREEAVQEFRRALQLKPNLAPVHNNLGIVLGELGHLDEALERFRCAVRAGSIIRAGTGQLGPDAPRPRPGGRSPATLSGSGPAPTGYADRAP